MTPLFKKLNYKNQQPILVVHAPESFRGEQEAMLSIAHFETEIHQCESVAFAMVFVTQLQAIETAITALHPKLTEDAVLWFCYPKGTSKKYKCEFNRDNGWAALGALGFEPVRMVAIDEDWSAMRFRKTAYIKSLTRNPKIAISAAGKTRAQKK